MRVKYVGPFAAVEVPDADLLVERGETVEVDDAVGARLVEQADNWQPVKAAAKKED